MGARKRERRTAYVLLATRVVLRCPTGETTVGNVLHSEIERRTFPLCVAARAVDLVGRYAKARDSGEFADVRIVPAEILVRGE